MEYFPLNLVLHGDLARGLLPPHGTRFAAHDRMLQVRAQITMHDGAGAPHRAVGARAPARRPTAASRCQPASHAPEARDGRASVRHDLIKTLPKVAAEMALSVLAYNLTRIMNIVGIKPLVAAIRA